MKVIGVSIGDIRSMFLLRSVFIGLFGGILGLLISLGLSSLLNSLFLSAIDPSVIGEESINLFSISIWLAVEALSFSALVTLISN